MSEGESRLLPREAGLLRLRRNSRARPSAERGTRGGLSRLLRQGSRKPGIAPGGKVVVSVPQSANRRQLLRNRARFMRHHPTYSEALLWSAIRGKRLGVQFRRQQVIGNHIVDFLCRPVGLVVEVDGDIYHAQQVALDARRDAKLRRAGFRVLRIPASLVEKDLSAAVELVREALRRS